jgi:hypothetical protein
VRRDPLPDDLARVLDGEPFGLSCDGLAGRLHRRRAVVLAVLRDDPRFEQHGRAKGSRWRITPGETGGRTRTGAIGDAVPWVELDPSGVPLAGREA